MKYAKYRIFISSSILNRQYEVKFNQAESNKFLQDTLPNLKFILKIVIY